jgi:hypothetical protein
MLEPIEKELVKRMPQEADKKFGRDEDSSLGSNEPILSTGHGKTTKIVECTGACISPKEKE